MATRLEQETIVNYNDEEGVATLYTASPIVYRRMVKRGYTAERIDNCSWVFEIPKKNVFLPRKYIPERGV